jgi:hypothetical protein
MRQAFIVSGILGSGTALVFAAAALTAAVFPTGATIPGGWNGAWGGGWAKGGPIAVPMPAPMIMPADGGTRLDSSGGTVTVDLAPAVEAPVNVPSAIESPEPGVDATTPEPGPS